MPATERAPKGLENLVPLVFTRGCEQGGPQLPETTRQDVLCCRSGRDERQGLEIVEVSRSRSAAEDGKKSREISTT